MKAIVLILIVLLGMFLANTHIILGVPDKPNTFEMEHPIRFVLLLISSIMIWLGLFPPMKLKRWLIKNNIP